MTRKPKGPFRVTVQGHISFPIDMLRYDHAFPYSESDSGVIHRNLDHMQRRDVSRGPDVVRVVTPRQPTTGRWESFGWAVTGIEDLG